MSRTQKLHTHFRVVYRSVDEAARMFKEAYSHNESHESLKCYFYALRLAHRDHEFMNEAMRLLDSGEFVEKIEKELESVGERIEMSGELDQVDRLKVLYQQGRTSEFDRLADEMISCLKANYRAAVTQ